MGLMRLIVLDGRADDKYCGAWARRLRIGKVYRSDRLIRLSIHKGPADNEEEEAHIEVNLNELIAAAASFRLGSTR